MIEAVDHNSMDALNTLSCLWDALHNTHWAFDKLQHSSNNHLSYYCKPRESTKDFHRSRWPTWSATLVATSRDALKAARPEGWKFSIKYDWAIERYVSSGCSDYKKPNNINTQYAKVCSPYLENITEELAELHAIIQAWIWIWENEGG